MSTIYPFQRGETILLALDVTTGDIEDVESITGRLRQQVAPNAEVAFTVSPRTGGWNLQIEPEVSETLTTGFWLADAKLTLAGQTIITDPVQVKLT